MIRSLWISKTGLDAQQTQMDVTANNLANVNTTGYKRVRVGFHISIAGEPRNRVFEDMFRRFDTGLPSASTARHRGGDVGDSARPAPRRQPSPR